MIKRLPEIKVSEATTPAVQYTMFVKIRELIDRINDLELKLEAILKSPLGK